MTPDAPLVVDAHNHYWVIGRSHLPWMDDSIPDTLRQTFTPSTLKPHMDAAGVHRSVIVEASTAWAEQPWYLDLCEEYDFVVGVIANLDLTAPNLEARLDVLARSPWFKGLRAGAENMPDTAWLARDDVRRGIRTVISRGYIVELLVKTPHLPHIPAIARENDGGKLIVDHMAKPPFESGDLSAWREGMLALAPYEHLRVKVSGLLTECLSAPTTETIQHAVDTVLDAFDINRLIWGSDWPVALMAASYEDTFHRVTAALDRLNPSERAAVLGGNAMDFYQLP
ncbi:MAG: amidohydrolase family protein [Chloroflexota bacterium]|nr:amidohydrolase family protein [Chloroflexota bacterium]